MILLIFLSWNRVKMTLPMTTVQKVQKLQKLQKNLYQARNIFQKRFAQPNLNVWDLSKLDQIFGKSIGYSVMENVNYGFISFASG